MEGHSISWILFGAYAVTVSLVAVWSRRKAQSMESFSVGTRTVSPFLVGLSLAANLTSAATFVINPGLIYLYGWAGVLGYSVATPLGIFLALIVFSKKFRRIGDKTRVITVPQWIGDRFGDARLTLGFSVLSMLQVTFLVLITVGLSLVLRSTLGISIPVALLLVIGFSFVSMLLGGASAHVLNNTIQAGIMITVAVIFLWSGVQFFEGGISGFFARLDAVSPHFGSMSNPDSLLFRDWFEVFVANFVIGVAIILQPHVISKALYLRSERDANTYLATAVVVSTLFFSILVTGLFARLALSGEVLKPDMVMATYIVEQFSPVLRAVVGLGILAAGFSTMEGILVALSSIFSNDFLRNVLPARVVADESWKRKSLIYARLFLVLLAVVTFVLSWDQILNPSLSVAMFAQNGVYAVFAASFAPVLIGVFSKRTPTLLVATASLAALAVHFGMYYGELTMYHNNPAVTAASGLLVSMAILAIGMAFGKRRPSTVEGLGA